MKPKFELSINSITVVNELPGAWSDKDCRALLNQLEFGDSSEIPTDQLREYAVMALQDLDQDQAADVLVDFIFGNALSAGKKQSLSEEMTIERLWEEYPDLSCHERIFNAQFLLNRAYPETPQPEINQVEAVLSGLNRPAELYLQEHSPKISPKGIPETLIVRCIACGLSDDCILNRLFEDQILGEVRFTEAEHILWHVYSNSLAPEGDNRQRYQLSLYTPIRWTGQLEEENVIQCEPFVRDLED